MTITASPVTTPPGVAIGPVVFPVFQDHASGQVFAEIPGVGKVTAPDLAQLVTRVQGYLDGMAKKVERIPSERRAEELAKAKAKREAAQAAMRQHLTRETAAAYQREALAYAFMALLFVRIAAPAPTEPNAAPSRRKLG